MPMIIKTLDEICIEKQRDVLYITFHDLEGDQEEDFRWDQDVQRKRVIAFLESHHIDFYPCVPPQYAIGTLAISGGYNGGIYVDVEFDVSNQVYRLLQDFLEDKKGKPRMSNVLFWYYTLENAVKLADNKEPRSLGEM